MLDRRTLLAASLATALPAHAATPFLAGDFLAELLATMKATLRVLGPLYRGPIMIASPKVGWALKQGSGEPGPNVVFNTTLFDFKGQALPVLDIWKRYTQ